MILLLTEFLLYPAYRLSKPLDQLGKIVELLSVFKRQLILESVDVFFDALIGGFRYRFLETL